MTLLPALIPSRVAWDLRLAWARGLRVSLAIEGDVECVEGFVERVSPTDAMTS